MLKSKALELLGGTARKAATQLGISPQAVSKWPDELSPRIADRVVAAVARKHLHPDVLGDTPKTEVAMGAGEA